jgi:hypothetical protein
MLSSLPTLLDYFPLKGRSYTLCLMTLGAFYVLTSLRFWTFGDECTLAERLDEKLRCFLAFKTFYDLPRAGFAAFST